MFYIQIDPDSANTIMHYCRNCGETDANVSADDMVVSSTTPNARTDVSNMLTVNKYLKYDPTLPRATEMLCPNRDCASNGAKSNEREILCMCTDARNMQYTYMCATCDTAWNTNK